MKLGNGQRLFLVLIYENLVVVVWNLGNDALEHGLSHWVQFHCLVPMVVFANPLPWTVIWMCLRKSGNVDEEAVAHVDPSCVDDVCAIAALALPDPWVDIQKIFPLDSAVVGDVWVFGLVVHLAEML